MAFTHPIYPPEMLVDLAQAATRCLLLLGQRRTAISMLESIEPQAPTREIRNEILRIKRSVASKVPETE